MNPAYLRPEVAALAIPVLAILGGVAIAVAAIIMDGRKKELLHKERLIAMEKGIPIPQEPRKAKRASYLKNRTGGLVMTFIGITLTIAMWTTGGAEAGVWGLPALGIGIGLLISSNLERKEVDHDGNGNGGTMGNVGMPAAPAPPSDPGERPA